jgi:hypothetical protein
MRASLRFSYSSMRRGKNSSSTACGVSYFFISPSAEKRCMLLVLMDDSSFRRFASAVCAHTTEVGARSHNTR